MEEKHETQHVLHHNDVPLDHDTGSFWGNVRQQIDTWHSGRGDRSVAASIIPIPGRNRTHDVPSNPLQIFRNMSMMGWLCFACGFLAWFCDGEYTGWTSSTATSWQVAVG